MNTQVHSSVGISPSQLIFFYAINHDSHFLTEPKRDDTVKTYHNKVDTMYKTQEHLLQIARTTQIELDNFHISQRDVDDVTSFPINSYVLAEYETRRPSKYHTNRHGPYRVVAANGSIYTLENLITHAYTDFHVRLLHEFKYDSAYNNPEKVAKHDKEYDDIRQILAHRFTSARKARSDLMLHIIWSRDKNPVWERWNTTAR
jgi:hypothetical protein